LYCVEFFEEMLSLVFNLTCERVSDRMWQTLPIIYDLFNKDNLDYFTGEQSSYPVQSILYLFNEKLTERNLTIKMVNVKI